MVLRISIKDSAAENKRDISNIKFNTPTNKNISSRQLNKHAVFKSQKNTCFTCSIWTRIRTKNAKNLSYLLRSLANKYRIFQ